MQSKELGADMAEENEEPQVDEEGSEESEGGGGGKLVLIIGLINTIGLIGLAYMGMTGGFGGGGGGYEANPNQSNSALSSEVLASMSSGAGNLGCFGAGNGRFNGTLVATALNAQDTGSHARGQKVIQLLGDIPTMGARRQQADPIFMRRDIGLPIVKAGCIRLADKHGAFKRGIVAADHRKSVERQHIPWLKRPTCDRVMRTVGIDP